MPAGVEPGRLHVAESCGCPYPAPRHHEESRLGAYSTRYPRYQSNTVTLSATTAWQEVIRFAGRPDRIDVAASAAGVEFRFRNRGESPTDALRVPNAAFHDTDISKEIVEARDSTGAGGQLVTAHGMWIDSPTS